jgi:ATP-dependent exoDNAse (exonuclease V) beta subunit
MLPPDQRAREAVRENLDDTIFLEAGAGSGKTTCLVDRFVALVESGVAAQRIAAITFTEKAAGELADRIRGELQRRAPSSPACAVAIDALDRAAIGTLHAFASRILSEHPIEAGLPPGFSVLDEIGSQLAFEARWDAFLDRILEAPQMERPLRLFMASGANTDHLHQVAVEFGANWDLVAQRIGAVPAEVAPVDASAVIAGIDWLREARETCTDEADILLSRLDELLAWGAELAAAGQEDRLLDLLRDPPKLGNGGRRANWPRIDAVKDRFRGVVSAAEHVRDEVAQGCLRRLADEVAMFTIESAGERRRAGELEFHDLLVLARALLRDTVHGPAARQRLGRRYSHLLLDEFQDTDPIQVELAVLIASPDSSAGGKAWDDVPTQPGRLFFVGDPKQSIYRFRRADISVFLRARDRAGTTLERLTSNFRSVEPILHWVNSTFAELIREQGTSQPAFVALDAQRGSPTAGPGVTMLGLTLHPASTRAEALRTLEAVHVAAAVSHVISHRWTVQDPDSEQWRPARWSDIAILLPARTSLRALEQALDDAGVPYRAETSSLVYGTGEVRDLLMVARAVDDPTDSLAVVAALRSAPFGCGDDDLFRWRHRYGGRWDHQAAAPEAPPDDPVAEGLAWLRRLHRERSWMLPSQVLETIVRERRMLELAFVHARPRDMWRRLRFVVDQCRAWEEAGGATLRDYLAWVKLQSAEGSRVIETVLPETDDDAVRILTVHGAKGLEFPVAVLSGMTTEARGPRSGVKVTFPPRGGWGIHIRKGLETAEFIEQQPIEEQMDRQERRRLLYVAATRARDHLIVSVHRKARNTGEPTAAELLYNAGWDPARVATLDAVTPDSGPVVAATHANLEPPVLPSLMAWEEEMARVRDSAARPVAVSATRLAEEAYRAAEAPEATVASTSGISATSEIEPGIHKDARDLDLPPWQKGRYGSAIGRAVHAVLQSVDLATGAGLEHEAAAQAAAEGVYGQQPVIQALARAALDSDLVRAAASRPHWREVYVGVPTDGYVLEGYIDLMYRDSDGLVIVDYKTDSWQTSRELADKISRYRVQLDAYRRAAQAATGEPVGGVWLLFLRPDGSRAEKL